MQGKIIIEGNSVYEVDEECLRKKEDEQKKGTNKPKEDKK